MKTSFKKLLIFVLVFNSSQLFAQAYYQYDTCNLDIYRQFEGEWRYANGTDTVRFYFRANRSAFTQGDFGAITVDDRLLGWHEYKKGNIIVESNYGNRFMNIPLDRYALSRLTISISLSIDRNFNPRTMAARRFFGSFQDFGLGGELIKVDRAIFSPTIQTLEWTQWRNDFSRNPESAVMTLPCCFTLIKQ